MTHYSYSITINIFKHNSVNIGYTSFSLLTPALTLGVAW